jgi:hypothetical protein
MTMKTKEAAPASSDLSVERGKRIDVTHYAVQVWDHQQLNQATLFYQMHQIPYKARRNAKSFRFTGREWRDDANCRLAEVELEYK